MIGAAGARRRAGERAGLDLDARPSLPWPPMTPVGPGSIRPRSAEPSGKRSLRARHALSQNFLADVEVLGRSSPRPPQSPAGACSDGRALGS